MIIDYVNTKCPACDVFTLADKHNCGCIFGHCDNCNTDFELVDKNCKGE